MARFDAAKAANEAIWLVTTLLVVLAAPSTSTAGDLTGIVLLYLALTRPLRDLHRVLDESAEAALQASDLLEDIDRPTDASYDASPENGTPGAMKPAPQTSADFREGATDGTPAVRLSNVTFRYAGSDGVPVLSGINLTVRAGERIGVVGPSGCGKSTLLQLLAQLVHGHEGDLLLHGVPVETIPRVALVQQIGYVGQTPGLVAGSVRDNLLLGRTDIEQAELERACARAAVLEDVMAMGGFDAPVGEGGALLSGGAASTALPCPSAAAVVGRALAR